MKETYGLSQKHKSGSQYKGVFFLTVFLFVFSGCDPTKLTTTEESGTSPIPWRGIPVSGKEHDPSLKVKFGVTAVGKDGVDAVFHELSAFIKQGGLDENRMIEPGDYIDLEGGLSVYAYPVKSARSSGGFSYDAATAMMPMSDVPGTLCRLIVVGINSFKNRNGDDGSVYTYPGDDKPPDHVVFQFQNAPVSRRMNDVNSNQGGYAASKMRRYLVPVSDDAASGRFLIGLIEAGVPDDVLWAPVRALSLGQSGTGTIKLSDKLWLPTHWEMFGKQGEASDGESPGSQTRLEYYADDASRIKGGVYYADWAGSYVTGGSSYWEASAFFDYGGGFCVVNRGVPVLLSTPNTQSHYPEFYADSNWYAGVVPAFCVY
jgi:hypothetical protein